MNRYMLLSLFVVLPAIVVISVAGLIGYSIHYNTRADSLTRGVIAQCKDCKVVRGSYGSFLCREAIKDIVSHQVICQDHTLSLFDEPSAGRIEWIVKYCNAETLDLYCDRIRTVSLNH